MRTTRFPVHIDKWCIEQVIERDRLGQVWTVEVIKAMAIRAAEDRAADASWKFNVAKKELDAAQEQLAWASGE